MYVYYGLIEELPSDVSAQPSQLTDGIKPFFPRPLPQPSGPLNLNLFKNPVPFNQTDWNKPFRVSNRQPDASQALNPNLFKNPIPNNQFDWAKPFRVPRAPFDLSAPFNPNIFKNPFPFDNSGRAVPFRLSRAPDVSQPYNPNLYGVVVVSVPFNQTDWQRSFFPRGQAQQSPALNLNLFTNPIPFAQFDWAKPFRVPRASVQSPDPLNINLFTNPFPFGQSDWSKPQQIKVTQPQPQAPVNINLFTNPVPFAQFDQFAARFPRPSSVPDWPLNLNLYGIVTVTLPFNQTDWTQLYRRQPALLPQLPLNINLFTNPIPFSQFDYAAARRSPAAPADPWQPLNINLFGNPLPFAQFDWSRPARPQWRLPDQQPLNIALLTGAAFSPMPFTQYDWTPARMPAARPSDLVQNFAILVSVAPTTPPSARRPTLFIANVGRLMNH